MPPPLTSTRRLPHPPPWTKWPPRASARASIRRSLGSEVTGQAGSCPPESRGRRVDPPPIGTPPRPPRRRRRHDDHDRGREPAPLARPGRRRRRRPVLVRGRRRPSGRLPPRAWRGRRARPRRGPWRRGRSSWRRRTRPCAAAVAERELRTRDRVLAAGREATAWAGDWGWGRRPAPAAARTWPRARLATRRRWVVRCGRRRGRCGPWRLEAGVEVDPATAAAVEGLARGDRAGDRGGGVRLARGGPGAVLRPAGVRPWSARTTAGRLGRTRARHARLEGLLRELAGMPAVAAWDRAAEAAAAGGARSEAEGAGDHVQVVTLDMAAALVQVTSEALRKKIPPGRQSRAGPQGGPRRGAALSLAGGPRLPPAALPHHPREPAPHLPVVFPRETCRTLADTWVGTCPPHGRMAGVDDVPPRRRAMVRAFPIEPDHIYDDGPLVLDLGMSGGALAKRGATARSGSPARGAGCSTWAGGSSTGSRRTTRPRRRRSRRDDGPGRTRGAPPAFLGGIAVASGSYRRSNCRLGLERVETQPASQVSTRRQLGRRQSFSVSRRTSTTSLIAPGRDESSS